jgi:hypothetical protein
MRPVTKSVGTAVAALVVAVLPATAAGAATTTPAHHCWDGCDNGWDRAYGPIKPGSHGNGYSEGDGSFGRGGDPYGPAAYCFDHPWRCR